VAKRRLESAIQTFTAAHPNLFGFKVQWHPFLLDPDLPKEGDSKMDRYVKKFGQQRVQQMIPYMKSIGQGDGINFSYGGLIASTFDSHRLIEWSAKFGAEKQNELVEELFKNYFEEEKNIGDAAVLEAAAVKVGLPEAKQLLANNEEMKAEVYNSLSTGKSKRGLPEYPISSSTTSSSFQEPKTRTSGLTSSNKLRSRKTRFILEDFARVLVCWCDILPNDCGIAKQMPSSA